MTYSSSRFGAWILPGAAAALIGSAAIAHPRSGAGTEAPVSAAAQSPFLGEWQLDLTRMPANYGPGPKQVTFSFADAGAGQWRTRIDITAPDGSVRHSEVQYRRDGTMAAGEGDTSEADSAAFMSPAPNVLVMSLAKNKAPGTVRIYTISADGREMTESAAGTDGAGAPFVREFHFKRIS
jgi:hypothetical protein